jgi:outer membrane immunogenic protein
VLSYVTAGYAFGNVKTNATQAVAPFALAFSTERTQSGWVVGSGVEVALGGNWAGKIEYLYLNLGNKTDISTLLVPTPINTEIRENIFRVGLSYRIGGKAYAPVVAANWAGFYLGGNFGSGTGRDRSSLNLPAAGIVETFNLAPDGINGGVQAGYNWQAANWVFGLEADIQGSTQKDNKTCVVFCLPSSVPGGVRAAYDATLPWFGTVRGRLGYSVGSTLFYATGGLAASRPKSTPAPSSAR